MPISSFIRRLHDDRRDRSKEIGGMARISSSVKSVELFKSDSLECGTFSGCSSVVGFPLNCIETRRESFTFS